MHERVEAIMSLEGKAIAHEFVRLLASLLTHFISINSLNIINSFLINVPIFYPLKTPENPWFSGVYRRYRMGTLAKNGLKLLCDTNFRSPLTSPEAKAIAHEFVLKAAKVPICLLWMLLLGIVSKFCF